MNECYQRFVRALDEGGFRKGRQFRCPAHEDHSPSLSVSAGDDGRVLLHCHAGCAPEEVVESLGLTMADLFEPNGGGLEKSMSKIVATYDYVDESGDLLFQVCRLEPKGFSQRRPDGNGGWIWKLDGVRRVLFRLPRVLEAARSGGTVYVVEGEKDVLAIEAAGGVGTCNPGGAGKWREEYSRSPVGARCRVIADNDGPGQRHAQAAVASLRAAGIEAEILRPARGKDASDHLGQGLGLDDFVPLPETPETRGIIVVKGGALPETVNEAEGVLLSSRGEQLYQRGGLLVRVIRRDSMTVSRGIKCMAGATIILPVELAYLVERFTQAAAWYSVDRRNNALKEIDCPRKIAETYMARGVWGVPTLRGIIEAPTLRPDGTILDCPGYDERTGLLFESGDTEFPPIPATPSAEQGKAACQALREILDEFPFVGPADEPVALSAMLTGLVRRSLRAAPIFAFRSPKMRSGKTMLADLVSLLATGRACAAMSQATTPEEERKRLLSVLLSGDPVICYDNIDRPFGGAAFAQALTQEEITDRILGISKTATVSTSATFLATGNNLIFEGDITARALTCDLDPEMERPEERIFKRDLYQYLPEQRGRLVAAALTFLRAFHLVGRPDPGLPRWAGFDDWSGLVRAALVWAGMPDPCETRQRIEEQDPVRQSLSTLLAAWEAHIGAAPMTLAEVMRDAISADTVAEEPTGLALRDALMDVAGRRGEINTRVLGNYLQANAMRIECGLRAERVGQRSRAALWRVVPFPGGGAE